jgi:hypothetical protein
MLDLDAKGDSRRAIEIIVIELVKTTIYLQQVNNL